MAAEPSANVFYNFLTSQKAQDRADILEPHLKDPQSPFHAIFKHMFKANMEIIELASMTEGTETIMRIILCITDNNTFNPQLYLPTKEEFQRYASYPVWAINRLQAPGNNMTTRIMASRIKNIKYYAEANLLNDDWSVMYDSQIIKQFPTRLEAVTYMNSVALSLTLIPPHGSCIG